VGPSAESGGDVMRLATIKYRDQVRSALVEEGQVQVLLAGAPTVSEILADLGQLDLGTMVERTISEAEFAYLPPVLSPDKIICVGLNYADHSAATPASPPAEFPSLFVRFPSSQVGHGANIRAPSNSIQFDYEGELAVIIGKLAWGVSAANALSYVGGYSCFAENSVRDFQNHSRQVTAGKNFVSSGAFGPWVVTAEEIPDPRELNLVTRINGEERQRASLSSLIFPIERLIEYISSFTKLLPGDVIATGTPSGVGALRKPPVWLKAGDRVEVDIPRVGLLANTVSS
jgi:2-keto-4-pentenoate hydratase/2-oxohepta-3-ene-1,7-dioic acid hydratase in catechol pathway